MALEAKGKNVVEAQRRAEARDGQLPGFLFPAMVLLEVLVPLLMGLWVTQLVDPIPDSPLVVINAHTTAGPLGDDG